MAWPKKRTWLYAYSDGQKVEHEGTPIEGVAERILAMLMNEAADAVFWQIASPAAIDLAMRKGVNYPNGLLEWADDWGVQESSTFSNRWDNATAKSATGSLPCCETSQNGWQILGLTLPPRRTNARLCDAPILVADQYSP